MAPPLPPGVRIHHAPPPSPQTPTTTANKPKRHRSLVATRPFLAGTPIATFSTPLLALPDGATMRTTCNYCLRIPSSSPFSPFPPSNNNTTTTNSNSNSNGNGNGNGNGNSKLRACTACRAAVYCGQACQRAHWRAVHRLECGMFARVRERAGKEWLPTPVRAVAQVMLLLEAGRRATRRGKAAGKDAGEGEVQVERERDLVDVMGEAFAGGGDGEGGEESSGFLEGNEEGFRAMEDVWRDFELQAAAAVVYAGLLEKEETLERARRVLCKIQTNAFNRLDADTGQAGLFLDPGLAMVNHSCVPNAFIGFDGRTAVLRSARDILEGEEITISYIDNTLPRAARHEALRLYHFQCACPRCEDDLDAYEVCKESPSVRLNSFSLQPDLSKLRNPPIDRSKVSKTQVEAIYKQWQPLVQPQVSDEDEQLRVARARWELCKPLVEAKMWAVEPLPTTILHLATRWQTSYKMVVYALPLLCFLSTECEPFNHVAPFMPWRVKGVMAIVQMLALTGEFTASGALATRCQHEGVVGTLATADQVTMCEGLLRLAVHHGSVGASEDWEVLKQAKAMLEDLEGLPGRDTESALLRAWAKDPEDPEGAAFFESQVLRPVNTLASFALEILEAKLGGTSLVKQQ
ncbi:hypothetical protein VTK26DRAFT_2352 [Humicola hyalothermophila]